MIGIDSKKIKQKGITLIEALISTAIVGIGFIAVFQMVNYSVTSIDVSGERTKTNYLSSMIAEDLIGDRFTQIKVGGTDKKIYEYLADNTKQNKYAWKRTPSSNSNKKCKQETGSPYKTSDVTITNKEHKWNHRFSKRIKCRGVKDIKELKVYESRRNNVKVDGKTRVNCHYNNKFLWNKHYFGRMEVKLNNGNKSKILYFRIK